MDFITNLPRDVSNYILEFVDYYEVPAYLAIKDEIQTYYLDHNWEFAKMCPFYYVHNYMSFTRYYFDKMKEPYGYISYNKDI
jgi:hypothetical protein